MEDNLFLIVLNSKQFSISDTSSFAPYQHGGIASQIKTPTVIKFVRIIMIVYTSLFVCLFMLYRVVLVISWFSHVPI